LYLGHTVADLPTCAVENEACEPHDDNVIATVAGIAAVEDCKQLCTVTIGCNVISHFGPDSSPFQSSCMLLRSCAKLYDCIDCRTEVRDCFDTCHKQIEGKLQDNFLETIYDVEDESTCLLTCTATQGCEYYTYYTSNDTNNSNLCVLLKEILGPFQACEHCSTGMPGCRNNPNVCQFSLGTTGTEGLTYHVFNESSSISFQYEALFANCELNILAVGGGGKGGVDETNSANYFGAGGGGSGYVQSAVIPLMDNLYLINVGAGQEDSSVETMSGRRIITAKAGKDSDSLAGGAGYSGGGGGGGPGNGGYNGGSGEGYYAGKGTNLDIGTILLENFQVSPGVGGKTFGNKYSNGGGGGGVLVDGEGPQPSKYAGQGFGFGGSQGYRRPGQGAVLLEMQQKQ